MGSLDGNEEAADQGREEIVFVLRVRPGLMGWRGQVQRLVDGRSARSVFVTSTQEIYLLLNYEWQLRTDNPGARERGDGTPGREPPDDR